MRAVFIILLFFFLGAFIIVTQGNLHLSKENELLTFYTLYYDWIIGLASNVGTTTANVVRLDWFPHINNTLE